MQSPNNTLIAPGSSITDAEGNIWTITADGQVAVNGIADPTTANVTHLAYANGLVWQENSSDLWWSTPAPASPWIPPGGTAVVPVPIYDASYNDTVVGACASGNTTVSIVDQSGNTWGIVNGQVAVNGVIDPTTADVVELAYVNGLIWQENSDGLWWSKAAPADTWGPPAGTTTNPVTGGFWTINTYGDNAIINVGELTASPNDAAGAAPDSLAEIVTPGIIAAATTILVSTETAAVVVDGNSSLSKGAVLNLDGAYRTASEEFGPLQNNGTMTVRASTLEVGSLTGTGAIDASAGSVVDIQSAGSGETIQLAGSHLYIGGESDAPGQPGIPGGMNFLAPIDMNSTSAVTLNSTFATTEVDKPLGGSLQDVMLFNGTTEVANLTIEGVSHVYATVSGSGATAAVTLSATRSSGDLPIHTHAGMMVSGSDMHVFRF